MRKLVIALGLMAALVLPGSALAGNNDDTLQAQAVLNPIGDSGITAEIEFVDTGTEILAEGEATGLTPGVRYVSLLYDAASVAVGPRACLPALPPTDPGFLSFAKMSLAEWFPVDASERHLVVGSLDPRTNVFTPGPKTGAAYTPIGTFATVSIRQVTAMGRALRACGLVETDD